MEYTNNLKLKKPRMNDVSDLVELDPNWDILDEQLGFVKTQVKDVENYNTKNDLKLNQVDDELEQANLKIEGLESVIENLKNELEDKINAIDNNNSGVSSAIIQDLQFQIDKLKEIIDNFNDIPIVESLNLAILNPIDSSITIEEPLSDLILQAATTETASFIIKINDTVIRNIDDVDSIDETITSEELENNMNIGNNVIEVTAYSSTYDIQEGSIINVEVTEEIVESVMSWGDNLISTLDGNTLTIKKNDPNGDGIMKDFSNISFQIEDDPSYYKQSENTQFFIDNNITEIIIDEGITNIGQDALNVTILTNVVLPSTLTVIGVRGLAFNKLTEVIFNDNLETIEESAFSYNHLTALTLPDNIQTIGENAFYHNDISIINNDVLPEIKTGTFSYNSLTEINFLNENEPINPSGFENNPIDTVYLYENMIFAGGDYETLGIHEGLKRFYIDTNNKAVGTYKWNGTEWYKESEPYVGINWGDNLTAYQNGDTLTISKVDSNGNGIMSLLSNETYEERKAILIEDGISKIILSNGVENVDEQAFMCSWEDNYITDLTIGNTITLIDEYAFKNGSLTILNVPDSVIEIKNFAFADNEIENLTLGENLEIIRESVFRNNKIKNLVINDNLKIIDRFAFADNEIETLVINDSSVNIMQSAFKNNNITSLTLGNSITTLNVTAFQNNNLTSITIPNTVTVIGRGAFAGNDIAEITIGSEVNIYIPEEYDDFDYTMSDLNGRYFYNIYNNNGKQAGTYTYNGSIWTKTA